MPDAPQSGLPPYPWPESPSDNWWENCAPGGDRCVGAPGTAWVFRVSELRNRLLALGAGASAVETALQVLAYANRFLSRWADTCSGELDPDDPDPRLLWVAPELEGGQLSVSVYQAVVHAANGPSEDLSHILHLRPKGGVTPDTTGAGCLALAERVGAAFDAWFADNASTYLGGPVSDQFVRYLSYDRITVSYLTFPGGSVKPEVVTGGHTWNWAAPLIGTGPFSAQPTLPLEVACCLSFLTDLNTPSTRGRVYLGGLHLGGWMDDAGTAAAYGLFDFNCAKKIADAFGRKIVDGLHNDTLAQAELNVVSRKNGSARGIGGIKVGVVPDSQRRRRWHQAENKFLAWGSAS